ncbi:unnamed protein product, partial [Hapterophycus canaliculatus]
ARPFGTARSCRRSRRGRRHQRRLRFRRKRWRWRRPRKGRTRREQKDFHRGIKAAFTADGAQARLGFFRPRGCGPTLSCCCPSAGDEGCRATHLRGLNGASIPRTCSSWA